MTILTASVAFLVLWWGTGWKSKVVDQFHNLQPHGDPMAFRLGDGDDPTLYRHYQGMARIDTSGIPYIILTRSEKYGGWTDPETGDYPTAGPHTRTRGVCSSLAMC
jgi:hypothetical protein